MQALWALVSALLFSVMGLLVKLASDAHSAWEILVWRNAVGLMLLLPVIRGMQGSLRTGLATRYPWAHSARNAAGIGGIVLWFSAIPHLPLATSTTLNYTSSLFVGLGMAVVALRRGPTATDLAMLGGLAVGFVGVILVLHPTLEEDQLHWALLALGSGASAGVALTTVKKLGRLGEPASRTVFYFALSGLAVGLLGCAITGWRWPDEQHLLALVAVGVTATLAQLAVTRAYGYGRTLLAANLNYAGILFASLWGHLFFSDTVSLSTWAGVSLIVGAGVASTWLTREDLRQAPPHQRAA